MDYFNVIVFAAAALLRLLLFTYLPSLAAMLADRVEISTPMTGFKRLQEGVFLFTSGVSPFDGGVYHQAPLLLPLFSSIWGTAFESYAVDAVYILADLASAYALQRIARTRAAVSTTLYVSPRAGSSWDPLAISSLYLFNPFSLATLLGRPTSVFTNCATLCAIAAAANGEVMLSLIGLAISSYLSLYTILIAPPLLLLVHDRFTSKSQLSVNRSTFILASLTMLMAMIGLLLTFSYLLTGSWDFLASSYAIQLQLTDLTPNIGLWWYFFIEMFDPFRSFFLAVFWLHMASYVGGLTIRLRAQPLFVITSLLGIFAVFKPYPSLADVSLYLGLIPLFSHIFSMLRYGFIATAALLYASFLGPAFHHLWIYAGSGNANFFYAITLVWSLGLSILVGDSLYAILRDEYESERPKMAGKELRMI